ncbi:hypothetical protein [Rhizobium sp. 11_C7_N12_5]|jgi:hypothetical protein|uniref:hypothetical protein n=1 Tax=Rhizobium sp. 11_C7_N12_5 TaxID=3240770 RepID=UPI003F2288CF
MATAGRPFISWDVVFLFWHMNCVFIGRPPEETIFMLQILPSLLLSVALGLSWNRFLLTFSGRNDILQNEMPMTMVAAAVSLSALGLSIADQGLLLGAAIVLLGLGLAGISKSFSSPIVGLSIVSLATYLQLTPHTH